MVLQYVGKLAMTALEYPSMQTPAPLNLQAIKENIRERSGSRRRTVHRTQRSAPFALAGIETGNRTMNQSWPLVPLPSRLRATMYVGRKCWYHIGKKIRD
jgi:hypothetical protein